jgi:hypothetical protein
MVLRFRVAVVVEQEPLAPPVLVLLRAQAVLEYNLASLE